MAQGFAVNARKEGQMMSSMGGRKPESDSALRDWGSDIDSPDSWLVDEPRDPNTP